MRHSKEKRPLCAFCGKKPATEKYDPIGHTEMVCAACFDRYDVQDAVQRELYSVLELAHRGKYEEALAGFDPILERYRHRDHDGWVANSVALQRASILSDLGRYEEAEQAYRAWAQIGFVDLWRRQLHALGLAKTLEALGRDREAVPVLENVLGKEEPKDLVLALSVLHELVRLSEKIGQPVDRKWLRIARAAAKYYGVDMPVHDSLLQTIISLERTIRLMPPPNRPSERKKTTT